jgi:hypothetical protein
MDDRLEQLGELVTPDLLLPSQFADLQRTREQSGERRLMLAVLQCAIEDLERGKGGEDLRVSGKKLKVYRDAHTWIFGDGGEMLSFALVCEVLELDSDVLRARLAQTKGAGFRHCRRDTNRATTRCVLRRRRMVEEG